MQRRSPERDVVARTPYRPPVSSTTRKGGRRLRRHVLSAGALVGLTVAAGVALIDMSSTPRVDVGFSAPTPAVQPPVTAAAAPAPELRLVVERRSLHVRLLHDGELVWRGRGPLGCLSGKRLRRLRSPARLVARGCIRLRSGEVVTLAARVPDGARVEIR
jgi:hypothetical protein